LVVLRVRRSPSLRSETQGCTEEEASSAEEVQDTMIAPRLQCDHMCIPVVAIPCPIVEHRQRYVCGECWALLSLLERALAKAGLKEGTE
jgi:hypothetical protein